MIYGKPLVPVTPKPPPQRPVSRWIRRQAIFDAMLAEAKGG